MTTEPTQEIEFADPVWGIAPGEDEMDFIIFTYYLEMPFHRRSIRGALRLADMGEKNDRIYKVAQLWQWEWRALKYSQAMRSNRLAGILLKQMAAQDTLIDGLATAAVTLIEALGVESKEDAAAARVRIQAATAILNMGGIDKAALIPLDVEAMDTADVEEVLVIDSDDEEMLDEFADWDDEEE